MKYDHLFKKREKRKDPYPVKAIHKVVHYVKSNPDMTWEELADHFGIGKGVIPSWCKKHNVKKINQKPFRYKRRNK